MEPSTDLAVIASRYQTINTVVVFDGSNPQQILRADSRRWYLRFSSLSITSPAMMPYPAPPVAAVFSSTPNVFDLEWKYRDAPSALIGEWYASGLAGETIMVTEIVYLGS